MEVRSELNRIRELRQRVLVVGLGISGIETARFLRRCGIETVALERSPEEKVLQSSKFRDGVEELKAGGVRCVFGVDGEGAAELFERAALAILSPGVSLESAICGALKRRKIPFMSELELGLEVLQVPSVIVTGSNGKSTTVTLTHSLLKASGFDATLCGNVGVPVVAGISADALQTPAAGSKRVLVVEASSYQLEAASRIKPKVGMLLNLSDNHLERHGTLQRYFEAKARLFANQDATDYAVLNAEDAMVYSLTGRVRSTVAAFGSHFVTASCRYGAAIEPGRVQLRIEGNSETYDTSHLRLLGSHNRQNVAAALLAARLMGAPSEALRDALPLFSPLEHRLELLEFSGRPLFINDSKSTTVAASVAALSAVLGSFAGRRIRLMLGGLAKAGSWDPLMSLMSSCRDRLLPIVCFGKDAGILASHCRRYELAATMADSLAEGVRAALEGVQAQDIVLLSPGCASFDEFSDFEHRGTVFKSLVQTVCADAQHQEA